LSFGLLVVNETGPGLRPGPVSIALG